MSASSRVGATALMSLFFVAIVILGVASPAATAAAVTTAQQPGVEADADAQFADSAVQQPDIDTTDLNGSGTPSDPYEISNVSELQAMEDDLDANYVLVTDIDASNTSEFNDGSGFDPVGGLDLRESTPPQFTGSFEGNNHTITGLTINRPDEGDVGLFGSSEGTVTNVTLTNVNITGNELVSGLVGSNDGTVQSVTVSGNVTATDEFGPAGGLVGDNSGTIQNATASVSVTGKRNVGGLVGNSRGTIQNATAFGSVNGTDNVGGLVGDNSGTIQNATASVSVNGSQSVGGLVGSNFENITDSSAFGSVNGTDNVGGLVGDNSGTIQNATASGGVNGSEKVGGLVGSNDANLTDTSASGSVNGTDNDVGGLVGDNSGNVTNATAFGSVNGKRNVGGLVGNSRGTIQNATASGSVTGDSRVGGLVGQNQAFSAAATITNATASGSVNGSQGVGGLVGENGGTIQNATASGSVTGKGFVGGLVGDNSGDVTNSTATGSVTATGREVGLGRSQAGGLVGFNTGNITDARASGSVNGTDVVGGLVGNSRGTIQNATASGGVNGSQSVGGLVGENDGTVQNATASGSVNGTNSVGGLVGENGGTIQNATASVSVTATGEAGSAGGLVGSNFENITDSSASGSVNGTDNVGGLVGDNSGTIQNATASGGVNGSEKVGGLVGRNSENITDSSASGSVNGSQSVGGLVGENDGTVQNATASGSVTGDSRVGGLVGQSTPFGTVQNATASGSVNGTDNVGGLVGSNSGFSRTIQNATASGSVNGTDNVGGLVGSNNAIIQNATASGSVTGDSRVGGLVGSNSGFSGTVQNATASGSVNGTDNVGGLVGSNNATIQNVTASGSVNGDSRVGGLVGSNSGFPGTIQNASASGSVNGTENVGGVVGRSGGTIQDTFAVGPVNGDTSVGGVVGTKDDGTVEQSYFDINTTGQDASAGSAIPLTTDEMQGQTASDNMDGFAFGTTWQTQTDPADYPVLISLQQGTEPEQQREQEQEPSVSVNFTDQTVPNGTEEVTVDSANFTRADGSAGDYVVVVHVVSDEFDGGLDNSISAPVGASGNLSNGAENITVDLNSSAAFEDGDALDSITDNVTLRAMLHTTANDSAFGSRLGNAIDGIEPGDETDDANITVEQAQAAEPSVSVNFTDQTVPNGTEEVTVDSANFTQADGSPGDYVVVVHTIDEFGAPVGDVSSPIGASDDLTGAEENITVDLNSSAAFEDGDALDSITDNVTLRAMLHTTANDSAFGTRLGNAIDGIEPGDETDDANITVEEEPPTAIASVTFDDQTVQNGSTSVNVASATFDRNGTESFNVVVHQASDTNDDGTIQPSEIGTKIGESAELDTATSTNISVNISKQVADNDNVSQLTDTQTLVAMLHTTNTTDGDNIVHTAPITRDGTPIFDQADVTVFREDSAAPGEVSIGNATVNVNNSATVAVTLDQTPEGVQTANITVSLSNETVGEIEDAQGGALRSFQIRDSSPNSITFRANDTGQNVQNGSGQATLATVTINGTTAGDTSIDASVNSLGDDQGDTIRSTTDSGTLTVTAQVVDNFDTDGDGNISITELSSAGQAFATGEISITELGSVSTVFAQSGTGAVASSNVTLSDADPAPGSEVTVTVTATPTNGSAATPFSFSHEFNQSVASASDITTQVAGSSVDPIIEGVTANGTTVTLGSGNVTAGEQITITYTITTAETSAKTVSLTGSVTAGNSTTLREVSYTTQSIPKTAVTFENQTVVNGSTTVTVASAQFGNQSVPGEDFVVVVHETDDGEIGTKIGESPVLEGNQTNSNIPVNLSKQVVANDDVAQVIESQELVAMLHTANTTSGDNNHGTNDLGKNPPVTDRAQVAPLSLNTADVNETATNQPGQPVEITATVQNEGATDDTIQLTFIRDGDDDGDGDTEQLNTQNVTVDSETPRTVSVTVTPAQTETFSVQGPASSQTVTIDVANLSLTDATVVTQEPITTTETVVVNATVTNTGTASGFIPLSLTTNVSTSPSSSTNGTVLNATTQEVGPDETVTTQLTAAGSLSAGTQNLTVKSSFRNQTVDVEEVVVARPAAITNATVRVGSGSVQPGETTTVNLTIDQTPQELSLSQYNLTVELTGTGTTGTTDLSVTDATAGAVAERPTAVTDTTVGELNQTVEIQAQNLSLAQNQTNISVGSLTVAANETATEGEVGLTVSVSEITDGSGIPIDESTETGGVTITGVETVQPPETETGTENDGFGVLPAVIALICLSLIARKRLQHRDED